MEDIKKEFTASTWLRPFGYLRNFEWLCFEGTIGWNTIWVRVYPIPYGLEIKKTSPLKGLYVFKGWSARVLRAND